MGVEAVHRWRLLVWWGFEVVSLSWGLIYLSAYIWGTFSIQVDRTDTIRKESPSLIIYTTSSA